MNFPTQIDYTEFLADLHEQFSVQWKSSGNKYSEEENLEKKSVLARKMSLERSVAMALEELISINKNN